MGRKTRNKATKSKEQIIHENSDDDFDFVVEDINSFYMDENLDIAEKIQHRIIEYTENLCLPLGQYLTIGVIYNYLSYLNGD